MANCFLCGNSLKKGTEMRRLIYSGSSIAGFNVTSHCVIDVIINSLVLRRSPRVRSFYVSRVVCQTCNQEADRKSFQRLMIVFSVVTVGIFAALAILINAG